MIPTELDVLLTIGLPVAYLGLFLLLYLVLDGYGEWRDRRRLARRRIGWFAK